MRRMSLTGFVLGPLFVWGVLSGVAVAAEPQEKIIPINGIKLHYVEQGQGEPVVFVHGAIADWRAWEMQRDAVAGRYQFVAYTRRHAK